MADKPKADPPNGMENYDLGGDGDLGALSTEQQQKLNQFKIQTRVANEKYLRQHPEVTCLISTFMREVLLQRPDDVREFAAGYFNDPELPTIIEQAMLSREDQFGEMKVLRNINREHS